MSIDERLNSYSANDLLEELEARSNNRVSVWSTLQQLKLEELRLDRSFSENEILEEVKSRLHKGSTDHKESSLQPKEELKDIDSETLYNLIIKKNRKARADYFRHLETLDSADVIKPLVVYEADSRTEAFNQIFPELISLAHAAVLVCNRTDLTKVGNGYRLRTWKYGELYDLCEGQRFFNQVCHPDNSGFLVRSDIVLTAGHSIMHHLNNIEDRRFIFDFRMLNDSNARVEFPEELVYSGKEIVAKQIRNDPGPDWAIVRLDRPASREVAPLRQSGGLHDRHPLITFGHPSGLPLKYANGHVRDNSGTERIITDLDTFGGNSGSLVATFTRGEVLVEGILISGQKPDYVKVGGCYRVKECGEDECSGEGVQRISRVLPSIP